MLSSVFLGKDVSPEQFAALKRAGAYFRTEVARAMKLRVAPDIHFLADTALDYAMKMDEVFKRPEVARDLGGAKARASEGAEARAPEGAEARAPEGAEARAPEGAKE